MAGIFISYRRDDSAGYAGWLYERLSARFGNDQVFMDVDSIEAGVDFVEIVQETVSKSGVVVALIGPQWLTVTDRSGARRLDDPNDFVRIELQTALEQRVRVIPTLVHGAQVPRADELPPELAPLVRRNAIELSDARFSYDVRRLIEAIERALGHTGAGPLPATGSVPALAEGTTAETATVEEKAPPPAAPVAARRTLLAGLPRPALLGGLAAVLAAIIIVVVVLALSHSGSPKQATGPGAQSTATPMPATSTPVPTRPVQTRPPATSAPAVAPTIAPTTAPASAPTSAPTSPPATSAPPTSTPAAAAPTSPPASNPTSPPASKPTAAPRSGGPGGSTPRPTSTPAPTRTTPPATAPGTAYGTTWQNGLTGWRVAAPAAWTVVGKFLRYRGGSVDQIIAPVQAPRGPYFVQAEMRAVGCRLGQHGFGVYVRIPNGASDGNDGVFAGAWTTAGGQHDATIWSLNRGFYRVTRWIPGTTWHQYRLVVRGNIMHLLIDRKAFGAAAVTELSSNTQVGLGSLNCTIEVAGFRLVPLK